jgi:putative ABC transport system permease protein
LKLKLNLEFLLAWRNIWRFPLRSALIISALFVGIWAGTFALAFVKGLAKQRVQNQLDYSLGHLKISHPQLDNEKLPAALFKFDSIKIILKETNIKSYSLRLNTLATLQAQAQTAAVDWYGVVPESEKSTLKLAEKLVEGKYLDKLPPKSMLIGEKLAQKLQLKLSAKIVITCQDYFGKTVKDTFSIGGIYRYHNHKFAETHIFSQQRDLRKILQIPDNQAFHQAIIRLNDYQAAPELAKNWQTELRSVKIQSWADVSPELAYLSILQSYFFLIFNGIIVFALTLLLINTMLMAVLERTPELGVLKAIGMNRRRLIRLVIYETLLLTLLGGGAGLLTTYLSLKRWSQVGIDLSYFGSAWGSWGNALLVYPILDWSDLGGIALLLFISSLLSAVYPVYKVLQISAIEMMKTP